jgi:hypothetical protein
MKVQRSVGGQMNDIIFDRWSWYSIASPGDDGAPHRAPIAN